jgi:hypothetical protein
MIAPRPMRVIAGEQDHIFPAEGVRQQFETLERAYAVWDAEDQVSLSIHPGGHAYNVALASEWFGEYV